MTTINVRAAQGRRVVTPSGAPVPDLFAVNPSDPYWARALRSGDVVQVDPAADAAATKPVNATQTTGAKS